MKLFRPTSMLLAAAMFLGVAALPAAAMAQKSGAHSGSMLDAMKSSGVFLLANNISIGSSPQR